MSTGQRLQMVNDVRGFPGAAPGPYMNFAIATVADVSDAATGADEGVVAFCVRCVMALQLSGLCAVRHLHHDHIVVFYVDDRREAGLFQRRPLLVIKGSAAGGVR